MLRWILFLLLVTLNTALYAKEWKSLRAYQKHTHKGILTPSDWLKKDRLNSTVVWQQANTFNLKNNFSKEYVNIVQRRDFYKWLYVTLHKKGHEVLWVNMAHFISKKIHLIEAFPYSIFTKKSIKIYANQGSETVFENAFNELQKLLDSQFILKEKSAIKWDKNILYKEQYQWIEGVYKTMDSNSLKTLERIAKRKYLYAIVVSKAIEFKGNLSIPEVRYIYALEILRPYCKNAYK